jgi:hypothetical protein
MDHEMIVGQLKHSCKRFVENILEAVDLSPVASASVAILGFQA